MQTLYALSRPQSPSQEAAALLSPSSKQGAAFFLLLLLSCKVYQVLWSSSLKECLGARFPPREPLGAKLTSYTQWFHLDYSG